ncbi:MAG: MerR family transcriptional regulator [Bacteroidales bacterium]|nr:MerR family transcriptional regulator [Bacteroidales bacterium]
MEKLFYRISEVAEIIGESTSLVRFWANSFPKQIKPKRNAKGNRLFTKEDVEMFKQIHLLVKVQGMTLEGAARKLSRKSGLDKTTKVLDSLRDIRGQLEEIRKTL